MTDQEKLISKTGLTGMANVILGVVFALYPSLFQGIDRAQMMEGIGAIMTLIGTLVIIFRRYSDGKKPTIV